MEITDAKQNKTKKTQKVTNDHFNGPVNDFNDPKLDSRIHFWCFYQFKETKVEDCDNTKCCPKIVFSIPGHT